MTRLLLYLRPDVLNVLGAEVALMVRAPVAVGAAGLLWPLLPFAAAVCFPAREASVDGNTLAAGGGRAPVPNAEPNCQTGVTNTPGPGLCKSYGDARRQYPGAVAETELAPRV